MLLSKFISSEGKEKYTKVWKKWRILWFK